MLSGCGGELPTPGRGSGRLTGVASLAVKHRLRRVGFSLAAHGLSGAGSVVVAHQPSCSVAGGILWDQGSDWCPLHFKADS